MKPLSALVTPLAVAATLFASTAMPASAVSAAYDSGTYQANTGKASNDSHVCKRKANRNGGAFVVKPNRLTLNDFPSGDHANGGKTSNDSYNC